MCGIIGIIGKDQVADRLVDGLRRMEYRGYDSAGVCTVEGGTLIRRRAEGKLANLVRELATNPAPGTVGIAPTRWATNGAPTTKQIGSAQVGTPVTNANLVCRLLLYKTKIRHTR